MQPKQQAQLIRASLLPLSRPKIRPRQQWRSRFRSQSRLQSQRWPLRPRLLSVGRRPPPPQRRDAPRHHQHQPGAPQRRRVSGIALRSVKPVETGQRTPVTDTAADSSSPTVPDGRHGVPLVARNSLLTRGKRHESSRSSSPNVFSPAPGGARGLGARASKQDHAFSVCFRFNESHHLHAASTGEGCRRRFAVIA